MSEVIEWLESDEGVEWSRQRTQYQPAGPIPATYRTPGPVDPSEDPTGRPPLTPEEIAATGEVA